MLTRQTTKRFLFSATDRNKYVYASNSWILIKQNGIFFQTITVTVLLYDCTIWTLTKPLKERHDDNYTRMSLAALNKSWKQHPTKQQLFSHLPPKLSETSKMRCALQEKKRQTNKQHSPTDSFTRTQQCWLSNKNLRSSALYEHWMLTGGLSKSDGW